MEKPRILVIAPHSDDETYGMGGTILKRLASGFEVYIVCCCAGDVFYPHQQQYIYRVDRAREFQGALDAYGCRGELLKFYQESLMDTVPLKELVGEIERVQREFKASTWYVPGPSFHQDHRHVFEACAAAARPNQKLPPDEIYSYEVPTYAMQPPEWRFIPQVWEDISPYLEKKMEILGQYTTQVRKEGVMSVAHARQFNVGIGAEAGFGAAERFSVVRLRKP